MSSAAAFEKYIGQRVGVAEQRVTKIEEQVRILEESSRRGEEQRDAMRSQMVSMREHLDELPEQFASIIDMRGLFYVKSMMRRLVYLLVLVTAGGAGAFGKALVEALF